MVPLLPLGFSKTRSVTASPPPSGTVIVLSSGLTSGLIARRDDQTLPCTGFATVAPAPQPTCAPGLAAGNRLAIDCIAEACGATASLAALEMLGLSNANQRITAINSIFFFQAEDGIRDVAVTGVQTCALPI